MESRSTARAKFEEIALRELHKQWLWWASKFGWKDRLTPPVMKLHDGHENLGRWRSGAREISFSRHLVFNRAWNETLEVLKHEMAHQFCDEILHSEDAPHGKTFQAVCHQHKIDAAPRGIPDATSTEAPNHIVEKIRRLLDLARGKANEHEAQRAAEAAHNLMLKYNIELREKNEAQNYVTRYFGVPVGRVQDYHSEVARLLRNHFFVETLWMPAFNPKTGKHGLELEITGTRDNIEAAEYVHDFLMREAQAAWDRTKDSKEFDEARDEDIEDRPWKKPRGYTLSARASYLSGFISGYRSTLQQARVAEEKAGLILARDPGLTDFFKKLHPHTVTFGSGGGGGNPLWGSQGYNAGKSLHVPPAARGAKTTPLLGK